MTYSRNVSAVGVVGLMIASAGLVSCAGTAPPQLQGQTLEEQLDGAYKLQREVGLEALKYLARSSDWKDLRLTGPDGFNGTQRVYRISGTTRVATGLKVNNREQFRTRHTYSYSWVPRQVKWADCFALQKRWRGKGEIPVLGVLLDPGLRNHLKSPFVA